MVVFKTVIGVLSLIFGGLTFAQFLGGIIKRKFDIIWFPQMIVEILSGLFLLGII